MFNPTRSFKRFGTAMAAVLFVALQVTFALDASTATAQARLNDSQKNAVGVLKSAKNTVIDLPEVVSPQAVENEQENGQTETNTPNENRKNTEAPVAQQEDKGVVKVTICHRTASYHNPYVRITVASQAVDGIEGNSGNVADHYGEHQGPVFYNNIPKHTEWGDIIPPVAGAHNGYNWTTAGKAIYNNDCKLPAPVTPTTPTTPVTPVKPANDENGQILGESTAVGGGNVLPNTGSNTVATTVASTGVIAAVTALAYASRRKAIETPNFDLIAL